MHLLLKYRVQHAVKVMLVYTSGSSQSISRALSISEYRRNQSQNIGEQIQKEMSRELAADYSPPHKPITKMIQTYL